MWETTSAIRTLADRSRRRYHLPWLDDVQPKLAKLDIEPLLTLMPKHGYTPDFLSPVPVGPQGDIGLQLRAVAATPARQVAREIARSMSDRGGQRVPDKQWERLSDPVTARDLLVKLLEQCWQVLLAAHWPRLRDLLLADISHQTAQLADRGLQALFADLHPKARWGEPGRLVIDAPFDETCRLRGRGLVLMPSLFSWPDLIAVIEPPWQPTLVYPARGIAALWRPTPTPRGDAVGKLIGRTRGALLSSLAEPATTSVLARRHDLSASTVSEHLSALRDAGLATSRRHGQAVIYAQTRLGAQLAGQSRRSPPARA